MTDVKKETDKTYTEGKNEGFAIGIGAMLVLIIIRYLIDFFIK